MLWRKYKARPTSSYFTLTSMLFEGIRSFMGHLKPKNVHNMCIQVHLRVIICIQ